MNTKQKIEQVKEHDWDDMDKGIITQWEELLRETARDEEYLNLPQTQKIVILIKRLVKEIDNTLVTLPVINPDELHSINDLLSKKQAYVTILQLYRADDDFAAIHQHLEEEIDNVLSQV